MYEFDMYTAKQVWFHKVRVMRIPTEMLSIMDILFSVAQDTT